MILTSELPISPGMIDSHFHYLEMLKKGMDAETTVKQCFAAGMTTAVDISTGTANFEKRFDFASAFEGVFMTAGIYPGKAANSEDEIRNQLAILEKQLAYPLNSNKIIAVGETGLDWYWNYGSREKQIMLFEGQLDLASRFSLPVVIHNRDADSDILDVLKKKKPDRGGIIHCFSSDYSFAVKCMDLGFYISFAGNVTYKKNTAIQEAAAKMPLDFVLAETDSPYLSPQPVRKYPSHPGFVSHTYSFISEIRDIGKTDFVGAVSNNFNRLFRIHQG